MILEKIGAATRIRVEKQKEILPLNTLRGQAEKTETKQGKAFYQALTGEDMAFICEVKKASPSKGIITKEFPYLEIAREYEEAGAAAISCLTEPEFFLGKDAYLREISSQVSIPVLRKDFTIDEYQIYEAKVLGAGAVLLICSLLEEKTLARYLEIVRNLGLSALVEAHDKEEIQMALQAGAQIIGVNNRNLKDFTVSLHNCLTLRSYVPGDKVFVAESGIRTREEVKQLEEAGVSAVLIGETLMRSPDKKAMLRELRG